MGVRRGCGDPVYAGRGVGTGSGVKSGVGDGWGPDAAAGDMVWRIRPRGIVTNKTWLRESYETCAPRALSAGAIST